MYDEYMVVSLWLILQEQLNKEVTQHMLQQNPWNILVAANGGGICVNLCMCVCVCQTIENHTTVLTHLKYVKL